MCFSLPAAFRALVEENVKLNVEKIANSAVIRSVSLAFLSGRVHSLNIGLTLIELQEPDNELRRLWCPTRN